ncbi:hypothetical protein [Novosphingobium jiangmenense]|uniref:Uncharacterized protein n=1 Tax=Novosphingobium jiangmenense TaxID=2791981 RepID=A0ABS0HH96_9SPHN|nr:hypothetical protein [Novosphingobium jiangmenense]MBF9151624.1 hypothetical protein [Novosphingobium jiangmenense]
MSHEQTGLAWSERFAKHEANPERLDDLAQWCERLGSHEQRDGFRRVLQEISPAASAEEAERKNAAIEWISLLSDSGAFESAAIALIPRDAIFTGGRLKDGSFVAQVILDGDVGAHSRAAQSLPMAWIAALLRAFARQAIEARSVTAH